MSASAVRRSAVRHTDDAERALGAARLGREDDADPFGETGRIGEKGVESVDDGAGSHRGHAPGALGQDDVTGREIVDADQTEAGAEVGGDGRGGKNSRAVALEGQ
jgi:hypothetical protein